MNSPETTTGLTDLRNLFTYHIFGEPDDLAKWQDDPDSYAFTVKGGGRSEQYALGGVKAAFEHVATTMILQCMTMVHWGRIKIRGVRLADVLSQTGVRDGARKIAVFGADGYSMDLFYDEVVQEPDRFLLAWEMNDEPLEPDHGFPLRVVSQGKYGFKWCKWVNTVEVTDKDFKGHYEGKRGWSDQGTRGEPV